MPLIDISIARGRSPAQLRAFMAAVEAAAIETVGATPDNITVIVREVERVHWARSGTTIAERDQAAAAAPVVPVASATPPTPSELS